MEIVRIREEIKHKTRWLHVAISEKEKEEMLKTKFTREQYSVMFSDTILLISSYKITPLNSSFSYDVFKSVIEKVGNYTNDDYIDTFRENLDVMVTGMSASSSSAILHDSVQIQDLYVTAMNNGFYHKLKNFCPYIEEETVNKEGLDYFFNLASKNRILRDNGYTFEQVEEYTLKKLQDFKTSQYNQLIPLSTIANQTIWALPKYPNVMLGAVQLCRRSRMEGSFVCFPETRKLFGMYNNSELVTEFMVGEDDNVTQLERDVFLGATRHMEQNPNLQYSIKLGPNRRTR